MSSDSSVPARRDAYPVPVPRTAVPIGIADPVEQARAELKAALFAIEDKVNVPKRISDATDDVLGRARRFQRENPETTAAIIVGVAALVGTAVWAIVRSYTD